MLFKKGQLPRPKLIVSNAYGTISAILQAINKITPENDLTGSTLTRVRTLARFIDDANFTGSNPFGTPDPNAEFPREIYTVDRKSIETREIVEFELAAVFDLAGVRIPKDNAQENYSLPLVRLFNELERSGIGSCERPRS